MGKISNIETRKLEDLYKLNKLTELEKETKKLLQIENNNITLLNILGVVYLKKKIFNKGKALGEKYIQKYPNSVQFRYWYLVNLGSWAQVYGILTAAREGVADQMKTHSEKIIALDPNYQDGGGYFMLGAVHYKSPYIPFLLSWPDNDDAINYDNLKLKLQ